MISGEKLIEKAEQCTYKSKLSFSISAKIQLDYLKSYLKGKIVIDRANQNEKNGKK